MKMFFILLPAVVFAMSLSQREGRVRRQIWPAPGNPNYFWDGPGNDRDFFTGDRWGSPRFEEPSRNFDNVDDYNDFVGNGNDRFQNDRNGNNRRRTTETLGPITSTPRTIHVAPQGCQCPMTQQFNPVCGTDGNTYRNKGLLNCYARCGSDVSQKRLGVC